MPGFQAVLALIIVKFSSIVGKYLAFKLKLTRMRALACNIVNNC